MTDTIDDPLQLEVWRPFLRMLARIELDTHLQAKIDPSDVVQQTMIDAHRGRCSYRGESDEELKAWLRRILARNLADEVRRYRRRKRDAKLECALNVSLDGSSAELDRYLTDHEASPVDCAIRKEQLLRLSAAIETLPDDQRLAVVLHHVQGLSSADISQKMSRTEISVAGLLRRGLKKLRDAMADDCVE